MFRIPFLITNRSVSATIDEKSYTVYECDPRYGDICKLLKLSPLDEASVIELKNLLSTTSIIERAGFKVNDGIVSILRSGHEDSWDQLPEALNETIIKFAKNKLTVQPLVNFASKLSDNPSEKSKEQLYAFLIHNDFTITSNGDFVAYKKIGSDWKDLHSKTIDNIPGCEPFMPRDQVDDDPKRHCSRGLHVANWDYAKNKYGSGSDNKMVMVTVNPMDVVSVPDDYNFSKIRVSKYRVLAETVKEYTEPLYEIKEDQPSSIVEEK